MPFDMQRARKHLTSFDLEKLFIQEMGWDHASQRLEVPFDGGTVALAAVAQKRGLTAFVCAAQPGGQIPGYAGRRQIEAQVRKSVHEHILIFTDAGRTRQVWQWVRREPGRPTTSREFEVGQGQSGEALVDHLQQMAFTLDEEEQLGIVDVTSRVRAAFDVERVTRRFYERFQHEHAALLGFLQGIPDAEMQRWYVSVTMNRLMFVYFIQKKGFLNGDPDYLRNRLVESKLRAPDRFYADFLCPLFFEGFAKKEREPGIDQLLGKVPYLNGGIFQKHEIEKIHDKSIQIPDQAFEQVFDFFDQYRWHLDERPLRDDREINPDVLGYIFEKYINQREMGAYYTKEDITGYISKSTLLPYLLDQARKDCAIAFTGEHSVWRLLQADPERYIYDAVKKGGGLALPEEIAAGIGDVSQRGGWNRGAAEEYALPTETWREVAARRERFESTRAKLAAGEVHQVDDLITYNLDIQQFTQDVVEGSEGPELVRAFWKALRGVKVLDPTCGSGAFLFAALNLLEPLYEACLERMTAFVGELDASEEKHRPEKYSDFRRVLEEMGKHTKPRYFILKSIIVNNLYGVDIMDEAVEICRLRLFLKLIAQVELSEKIEPLPDIDFNIQTGNTLVGFTRFEEVQQALTTNAKGQMFIPTPEIAAQLARIEEEAGLASQAFERFQEGQLERDFVEAKDKEALRGRLEGLNRELNRALAKSYGVNADGLAYGPWEQSHKPFHWYVEFYGIMKQGGFDVIIGNPPYINLQNFSQYQLIGYKTIDTGNLYPAVLERCSQIAKRFSFQGFIVPISSTSTEGYSSLQKLLHKRKIYISCYDDRPGHLFNDLDKNTLSIIVLGKETEIRTGLSTRLNRWNAEERSILFGRLFFEDLQDCILPGCLPKIGSTIEISIWNKLWEHHKTINNFYSRYGNYPVYYARKINAFLQVLNFIPEVRDGSGNLRMPSEFKKITFNSQHDAASVFCCLSSSLFRWFIDVTTDGSHLNKREIDNFPFDPTKIVNNSEILNLAKDLAANLKRSGKKRVMRYSHDTLTIECIFPKYSKNIIDMIDQLLAKYYGLTDEELDYIINYDIKYRMGAEE